NFRRSARRAEHGRNRGQGSWEGQVAGQGDLGVGLWRRGGAAKTRPIGGRRERPSRRLRGTGAGLARASLFPGEPKGLGPPSRDSPGAYGDWEPNAILLPIARAARGVGIPKREVIMRGIALFVAGIVVGGLAVQAATAQNNPLSPNKGIVGMNHVGIIVPDID